MKIRTLEVHGIEVTVERKRVKNINLAVYPPDGRVRVSAPRQVSEELIRSVIAARLGWINTKRAALLARPLRPTLKMEDGETLMLFGESYRLLVLEREGRSMVGLPGDGQILLQVRPGATVETKTGVLYKWYREQLGTRIPLLLEKWQPIIGLEVREWRIRRMKSRWGTCNIRDRRIWLNLELARMAPACLEYVVVHELVHLLERRHNSRFWSLMDGFLPDWRIIRQKLKMWSLGSD